MIRPLFRPVCWLFGHRLALSWHPGFGYQLRWPRCLRCDKRVWP